MKIIFLDFKNLSEGLDLSAFSDFGKLTLVDCAEEAKKEELIKQADVLITSKCTLTKETLSKAETLRLICVAGTDFSNVDLEYCQENGIVVTNVPDADDSTLEERTRIIDVTYENIRDFFNGDTCNRLD